MIVATAGHIDHGKTRLVKALTGVDTDRLPEEQQRGLTIDLGFAYRDLGNGELTGFVDVPGHERFIRTMLAGVSGIDFVVFVIAADDGPMPQTAEHLAIMDLLEVRHGVIALTKVDRVAPSRIAELHAHIAALIAPTCLMDAPIIPVSAVTGEGIDTLRDTICRAATVVPERRQDGNFRLAIDRSFVLAGAGRVVTGTVFSGTAQVGEQLALAPNQVAVRVRSIHALNRAAPNACAGQRCALNIVGSDLRRADIHRGDWVLAPSAVRPIRRFDARVRVLAGEAQALKNRTPVHVHVGAADVTGRIVTLAGGEIAAGDEAFAQVQLEHPICTVRGDHFVLRDQSALRTIGGGVVLDPFPISRGRTRAVRLDYLRALDKNTAEESLAAALTCLDSVPLERFRLSWNLTETEATTLWSQAEMLVIDDGKSLYGFRPRRWQDIHAQLLSTLQRYHQDHPTGSGMKDNDLRLALAERLPRGVFSAALNEILNEQAVRDGGGIRLRTHRVATSPEEQALWEKVSTLLREAGPTSPVAHDLATKIGISHRDLTRFLTNAARQEQLIRVNDKRYFLPETIRAFVDIVEALVAASANNSFTVKAYRDRAGIGRNATIDILEYFDRSGYTRRSDQSRSIRKSAQEAFKTLYPEP